MRSFKEFYTFSQQATKNKNNPLSFICFSFKWEKKLNQISSELQHLNEQAGWDSGSVVSTVDSQKKGPGFEPTDLSLWSLHILCVCGLPQGALWLPPTDQKLACCVTVTVWLSVSLCWPRVPSYVNPLPRYHVKLEEQKKANRWNRWNNLYFVPDENKKKESNTKTMMKYIATFANE